MCPQTVEMVLTHEVVSFPRKFLSEYRFQVGELRPFITIRLYESIGGAGIVFEQSHFIQIPGHIEPYRTSITTGTTEADALHKAVSDFTMYYDIAIRDGRSPDDAWLIPNPNFR